MINMNPSRAMLLFVLPMIAGNLFQQLYNMADSAIAGQFIGPQALSAIGASYAITNVFIASASGGSMGCAVVISQYFGSGDYKKMKTCISTALVSILSVSLILAAAGSALSSAVLGLIKTPPDVFDGALIYLKI